MTHTPNRRVRIAKAIQATMEQQGVTPAQLAAAAGISIAQILRRLEGKRPFFLDELAAIASRLNTTASDISRRTDVTA